MRQPAKLALSAKRFLRTFSCPHVLKHDHSEESIADNFFLISGISCLTTFHVRSKSTSKYSCINMSLIPAICFHGMSGYLDLNGVGKFLTASPIISRRRMIASCIERFFWNFAWVIFVEYSSIRLIDSRMWARNTLGSFFTKSLFVQRGCAREFSSKLSYK